MRGGGSVFDRVFHPYTEWEDYRAGMWRAVPVDTHAAAAAAILGDPDIFYGAAVDMLAAWPNAAEHNLTNLEQNRRAWLGQAACCYLAGASEAATRLAWWLLLLTERDTANAVADRVIAEWEQAREQSTRPALFLLEEFWNA
jgi:hypothetical protein